MKTSTGIPNRAKPGDSGLRKARIASGMTLRQVSAETGINVPSLSRLETGKLWPTREMMMKIRALFTELTADDILDPSLHLLR